MKKKKTQNSENTNKQYELNPEIGDHFQVHSIKTIKKDLEFTVLTKPGRLKL